MPRHVRGSLNAEDVRLCLVVSRYNRAVTGRLVEGAVEAFLQHGGREEEIDIYWTPGSFELPMVARARAVTGRYDAIVGLGCLVRGETVHFDLIAREVSRGLFQVGYETGVPTVFGLVTAETLDQALERAGGKGGGRGWDAVQTVIELVDLLRQGQD